MYFVVWVDAAGRFQNEVIDIHPMSWFEQNHNGKWIKQGMKHSSILWWKDLEELETSSREEPPAPFPFDGTEPIAVKRGRGRFRKV